VDVQPRLGRRLTHPDQRLVVFDRLLLRIANNNDNDTDFNFRFSFITSSVTLKGYVILRKI